jgi:hypothetical protein
MISPVTWWWNFRHRKVLNETIRLMNFKYFLERECGIRHNFSIKELKAGLEAAKKR